MRYLKFIPARNRFSQRLGLQDTNAPDVCAGVAASKQPLERHGHESLEDEINGAQMRLIEAL
jgi:hypothetical protein